MNCYLHEEVPAAAYCRSCGKPLCAACQRPTGDTVFCQEHAPPVHEERPNPVPPPPPPPFTNPSYGSAGYASAPNPYLHRGVPVQTSPGLAFLLGFIPGVGAIYNGQYLKGLVHAVIFGLIVSLLSSLHGGSGGAPLLGMMLSAFVFYMPFEAYHTSKKRLTGAQVEEWSSLMGPHRLATRTPIGPIFLIVIGLMFLLDTLHLLEFRDLARFWPVLLILVGAFMLYSRIRVPDGLPASNAVPPVRDYPPARDYVEPRL